jgi:hypothetical protein
VRWDQQLNNDGAMAKRCMDLGAVVLTRRARAGFVSEGVEESTTNDTENLHHDGSIGSGLDPGNT